MDHPSFERLGPAAPASPVILSVPHAGRAYPHALIAAARAPLHIIKRLEDRFVDHVARAARGTVTTFIQHAPRALIDLNRSEQDRDPLIDEGARATMTAASTKLRSGLGLVPRRVGTSGDLWRGRFTARDIDSRIERAYRPYHVALDQALQQARACFGSAILIDLHSMPSLGEGRPQIVLGDRFGTTASARLLTRMEAVIAASGLTCAHNVPYAGGHILARHGHPAAGVHAVQLELDRALYLDSHLIELGPGLNATAALVTGLIAALADEAIGPQSVAAE